MSWLLFDERGNRAQKLTMLTISGEVWAGWAAALQELGGSLQVLGFLPERSWRPTFFAAKMAKGWRVFELDVGEHQYVDQHQLAEWWQPATQIAFGRAPPAHEKRFPNIAAVEMWVRMVGART